MGRDDEMRSAFGERYAAKTRDEWTAVFAGSDACVTPVLSCIDASDAEHLLARRTLVEIDGVEQAAPAPRLSRTPA